MYAGIRGSVCRNDGGQFEACEKLWEDTFADQGTSQVLHTSPAQTRSHPFSLTVLSVHSQNVLSDLASHKKLPKRFLFRRILLPPDFLPTTNMESMASMRAITRCLCSRMRTVASMILTKTTTITTITTVTTTDKTARITITVTRTRATT